MEVPSDVREAAALSLKLRQAGYDGGTPTGWNRAKQLVKGYVDDDTIKVMHAWFARHRITSYPNYVKRWVKAGRPTSPSWSGKHDVHAAVAWLLWGGDPGYEWIRRDGEARLKAIGKPFNPLPKLGRLSTETAARSPVLQMSEKSIRKTSSPQKRAPRRSPSRTISKRSQSPKTKTKSVGARSPKSFAVRPRTSTPQLLVELAPAKEKRKRRSCACSP